MFPFDNIAPKDGDLADAGSRLRSLSFDDLINQVAQDLVRFAIHLAIAILVFYAGKFIIKRLYRLLSTIMLRRNIEPSLMTFVLSTVNIVLYFILIVTVIGILGIETSSFLALFASAGVAIGMALSGTLQNFAGGVLVLLLKPYKIGDYIEAQGYAGTVTEIQIFNTLISTPDNKAIIIPNGTLSTSSINNWSRRSRRRISWTVSLSYGDDVEAARKAILDIFASEPRILTGEEAIETDENPSGAETVQQADKHVGWLRRFFISRRRHLDNTIKRREEERQERLKTVFGVPDYKPSVVVSELASSSVDLSARAWVMTPDYWGVFYSINERIYTELPRRAGISFPFPQLDVHMQPTASDSKQAGNQ